VVIILLSFQFSRLLLCAGRQNNNNNNLIYTAPDSVDSTAGLHSSWLARARMCVCVLACRRGVEAECGVTVEE